MLVKNKDASSITLRNQNKTLYANYVIQQTKFQGGCLGRVTLESGRTGDYSILNKLKDGEQQTTLLEQRTDVSANLCPVLIDPYLSDAIYLALTTNQAAYKAAALGAWVSVTSAEYTAVQTSVTSTSLTGSSKSIFEGTYAGIYTFSSMLTINKSGGPVLTANTYLYGFALVVNSTPQTTMNDVRVYTNNSTSGPTYKGFVQVGSVLPTLSAGRNYFVRKGVNQISASTDGYLAISAPGGNNQTDSQAGNIPYNSSATGYQFGVTFPVTFPVDTNTSIVSQGSLNWSFGIQGLITPSIQWVTQ